jgi:hypothetical protein
MTGTSVPSNEDDNTFQDVFIKNIGCLSGHAIISVGGTLLVEQVILFWFE